MHFASNRPTGGKAPPSKMLTTEKTPVDLFHTTQHAYTIHNIHTHIQSNAPAHWPSTPMDSKYIRASPGRPQQSSTTVYDVYYDEATL